MDLTIGEFYEVQWTLPSMFDDVPPKTSKVRGLVRKDDLPSIRAVRVYELMDAHLRQHPVPEDMIIKVKKIKPFKIAEGLKPTKKGRDLKKESA